MKFFESKWVLILPAILIVGGALIIGITVAYDSDCYFGKEVFQTEEEYTQFKTYLAADDINIIDMSALSSAPPIIVEFEVSVPHGRSFAYGDKDNYALIPFIAIGSIILIMGPLVAWLVWPRKKADNKASSVAAT